MAERALLTPLNCVLSLRRKTSHAAPQATRVSQLEQSIHTTCGLQIQSGTEFVSNYTLRSFLAAI